MHQVPACELAPSAPSVDAPGISVCIIAPCDPMPNCTTVGVPAYALVASAPVCVVAPGISACILALIIPVRICTRFTCLCTCTKGSSVCSSTRYFCLYTCTKCTRYSCLSTCTKETATEPRMTEPVRGSSPSKALSIHTSRSTSQSRETVPLNRLLQ